MEGRKKACLLVLFQGKELVSRGMKSLCERFGKREALKASGSERTSVSTKLRERWSGPFRCTRMDKTRRYAWILKDGQEVRHHVNRLAQHHIWSEFRNDSADV